MTTRAAVRQSNNARLIPLSANDRQTLIHHRDILHLLPQLLRASRARKGVSTTHLANALGVTPGTIVSLETGPRDVARVIKWLPAITKALGISLPDLLATPRPASPAVLADRIKQAVAASSFSRRTACLLTGCPTSLWDRMLAGRSVVGWEYLPSLAYLLDLPLSSLLDAQPEPSES
jgi:DNA-binding XRE family transcriptional regulator